jgi:outer membrane protein OmpA-like peptidoglycan-associated protein
MFKACFYIFITIFSTVQIVAQHSLRKLPPPINTDLYNEICPVLNYEERLLFFTRVGSPDFNKTLIEKGENLFLSLDSEKYNEKLSAIYSEISGEMVDNPVESPFNQDIWMADVENDYSLEHPGMPVNNALPNSICSNYSRDNEYVLINQFPVEGGLKYGFSYTQQMDNGRFTIPIAIKIHKFNKKGATVNLSMSNDKQHIFIAMRGEGSYGDQDIFLSRKSFLPEYGKPENLGRTVNTEYRESTPFISQDKRRLYFASDRPGGYGGMDIYYCERLDYTYKNWSEPKLFKPPINSEFDDSHPYVSLDDNTIYFSSNRDGTSDIFSAKMYRDDLMDKPMAVNINILDKDSVLIQGEIYWKEAYTDEMTGFFRTNTGQYRYIIEENTPMVFKAQRRSLRADEIMVDPQEFKDRLIHEVTLDFVLRDYRESGISLSKEPRKAEVPKITMDDDILPLETNRTIILNNIYFAQSKPDVLKASYPALEQLAGVLKKRPHVIIRIEGHTDNVGDKKALMELSWQRAEAIKSFLVDQGVMAENIETEGFGDTKPITNNSTEAKRRQNRRVEIRVIKQ